MKLNRERYNPKQMHMEGKENKEKKINEILRKEGKET